MNHLNNHGLVIRELRKRNGLSIQKTALLIEKSVGWLCEIENGLGTSRLRQDEFDRITGILGGANDRHMFKTWIANQKNLERINSEFDGAVLKYIRMKKKIKLADASRLTGFSKGYLSKLENGWKPVSLNLRNQIMTSYGYSPTSFKNLCTGPERSKAVPSYFKFKILMRRISKCRSEAYLQKILCEPDSGKSGQLEVTCTNI